MQTEQLTEQIMRQIDQAAILYHRLILVVAPSGMGKTKVLQEVAKRTGGRYINMSLDLSRQLPDFTERQRALKVSRVLSDIVGKDSGQAVLLDNTEVLFDVSLKQDPLRCLQLKVFRLEAVRAGFKKAWAERNYQTILNVGAKIPEQILQEDPKLLMWYDQALTRTGGEGFS